MNPQMLHPQMLQQIKDKYKAHLHTDQGQEDLRIAVEQKRMWMLKKGNSNVCFGTNYVKQKFLPKSLNKKIKKVSITPVGLNNLCHDNSRLFAEEEGITARLGFNITSCPCGRNMTYEIHSVNKINGELYDFTRDFNDETEKYFLEVDTESDAYAYVYMYGKKAQLPININKGCKCKVNWRNGNEFLKTEEEFLELIENLERIKVIKY
jgi:hypothetical protein